MNGSGAERAENSPFRQTILPRESRAPVLAARLFLATVVPLGTVTALEIAQRFSAQTPVAQAQATERTCRVGVRIESYAFFDMAQIVREMGRRHILDMGIDPRAGSAAGFVVDAVTVTYKEGDRKKANFRPLGSTNIIRDQGNNVGRGQMEFTAPCNATAVTPEGKREPALRYKLTSNLEDNDQFEVVIPNNKRSVVAFGSEIKRAENFLEIVESGSVRVEDFDAKKAGIIRNWLAAQKVAVTGVITPAAASRTPTATYTEEVRAALEKVMGERLDKAISPLREDLRGTNTALSGIKTDLRGQKDSIDELSKRTKSSEEKQGKTEEELAEIKRRLPVPPAEDGGLLNGVLGAAGFVLDLPAKAVNQVIEPDIQFPLKAVIDALAWLVLLRLLKRVPKVGIVGIPGAYILGTSLYPIRYGIAKRKHSRVVAATVAGQQAPAWKRPTLSI